MDEPTIGLTQQQVEGFRIRLEATRTNLQTQITDAERDLTSPEAISDAESLSNGRCHGSVLEPMASVKSRGGPFQLSGLRFCHLRQHWLARNC